MYGTDKRSLLSYDFLLLGAVLLASGFGLVMISSAVRNSAGLEDAVIGQARFLAIGIVLALAASAVDYRLVAGAGAILYAVGIASLLVVAILGTIAHGGQRWIPIGGYTIQPSEFMKVWLVVMLAQYLGPKVGGPWRFRYLIGSGVIVLFPAVLIYAQPDLGTALVLLAIWGFMVYVAGVSMAQVAILAAGGVAVAPLVWFNLQPYMQDRVRMFLQPDSDPAKSYVVDQALISIGSGSIWGKGYAAGSQSQLHFLRVRHTDFIFSVIGEELGLVGAICTLMLLAFICYRLFSIAQSASDGTGRLLALGAGAVIALHTIVNVAMNVGLLPVTGLPLPFISQGGSALVAQFMSIGIAESVALRRY